ncbi:unnamed protein product [Microthlaspi erraticum]|uniref:Uncharacterized protein n=1 Tax=Microthlaspi erraticum TaxID=1685480 RepID=A0A6D2JFZ5_9BRAS|nr:unnamed protein product [Microthlaspi erraticum]
MKRYGLHIYGFVCRPTDVSVSSEFISRLNAPVFSSSLFRCRTKSSNDSSSYYLKTLNLQSEQIFPRFATHLPYRYSPRSTDGSESSFYFCPAPDFQGP